MVWDLLVIRVDVIININNLIFYVNLYICWEIHISRYMHWNEYIKMLHTHLSIQKKEKK